MEKYYLMPCERQNQESCGCKAVVEVWDDGTKVLYSYLTKVAKIIPGGYLVRLCGHDMKCSSPTTMRHLVAFCVHCTGMTASAALEVLPDATVVALAMSSWR